MNKNLFDDAVTIIAYTRKQAIADGEQILLEGERAQIAKDLGFKVPVYFTCLAWSDAVKWEKKDGDNYGQDEKGRLHDVLFVLLMHIKGRREATRHIEFSVSVVQGDGRKLSKTLYAEMGPADIDDPTPALTIMTEDDL